MRPSKHKLDTEIRVGDNDYQQVRVEFTHTPGRTESCSVFDAPNAVEVTVVTDLKTGEEVELSYQQNELVMDECWSYLCDKWSNEEDV